MKRSKSYLIALLFVALFVSGVAFNASAQEAPSNISVAVKERDPDAEFRMQSLVPYSIFVKVDGKVSGGTTVPIYFDETISFLEISNRVIKMKQDNGVSVDIAKIEYEDDIRDYLGDVIDSNPIATITFLPGIEQFESPYFIFNGYVRAARGNEPNTNIVANAYLDSVKTHNVGSVKYKYSPRALYSEEDYTFTSWLSRDDYNFYMVLNRAQIEDDINIMNFDVSAVPYADDPYPPMQMNGYFNQIDFAENENPLEMQEFLIYKNAVVDNYGRILDLGEQITTPEMKITDDKTQTKPSAPTRSGLVMTNVDTTYLIFLKASINPLFEPEPDFDGIYWINTKNVYNLKSGPGKYIHKTRRAGFYYNPVSQASGYADIDISKSVNNSKVYVGEELTYTISVANSGDTNWNGTVNDLINLKLVDIVPNSTTLDGVLVDDRLHWENGLLTLDVALEAHQTKDIQFKVIPRDAAVETGVSNSATINNPDTPDTIITPPTKVEVLPTLDITVSKVWVGDPKVRPNVRVQLYQDGQPYGDIIELSEEVDWTYEWTDLPKVTLEGVEYVYTVDEIDVPEGFIKSIDGFTITNTVEDTEVPEKPVDPKEPVVPEKPTQPNEPKDSEGLPNTGISDTKYLMPLIGIVGGMLIIIKSKKKEQ